MTTVGTPRLQSHVRQFVEPERVVRSPPQRQRHIGAVAESLGEPAKTQGADVVRLVRDKDRDQALAVGDEIGPIETAPRLAAALLAQRQQSAQPRIGGPVGRIDEDGHAVGEIESAADDQSHARRLRGLMRADDAGERIAVDDRHRLDAQGGGLLEQFLA